MNIVMMMGCVPEGDIWQKTGGLPPTQETTSTFEESYSSYYSYYSEENWVGQWGEVSFRQDGAVGESYTGFAAYEGGQALCDVAFVLRGGDAAEGCPDCDTALSFVLENAEISVDEGGRCEELGWLDLEGSTLVVGHASPDALWQQVDGDWTETGWSDLSEAFWEFEIPLY
jgi:hypothetical protein